ncbi:MAG: glycosyltransferase family 4 protein [Nitrospinae bacterium]|nr:glycosyltransferase family 4 protein [Nitrospinota bacterium]
MANRRVLIITDSFPPAGGGAVQRIVGFCKYLPSLGWKPLILTLRDDLYRTYDYSLVENVKGIEVFKTFSLDVDSLKTLIFRRQKPALSKVEGTEDRSLPLQTVSRGQKSKTNPQILKLNWLKSFMDRYIFIPDPKSGWLPFAILKGIKIVRDRKPDVIFAVYPYTTSLLIGYILHKFFKIPIVLDMHDTWTLYPEWLIGVKGSSPLLKIRQRLEETMLKLIFNSSSAIITNTEYMKNMYIKRYPSINPSKYVTINNGYDPDDFVGIENENDRFKIQDSKFKIIFSGRYYRHHYPLYFLKGLNWIINKYPDIRNEISAIFMGSFGKENEYIVKKMGLEDIITIIEYLPYKENLKILSNADLFLITLIPPSDFNGYRIPSKVPEYLYLKKPILAIIPDGELKQLIEKLKAGIVVEPADIEGIGNAIYELYNRYKNNSLNVLLDEESVKKFDYKILSKKMADVLLSVIAA